LGARGPALSSREMVVVPSNRVAMRHDLVQRPRPRRDVGRLGTDVNGTALKELHSWQIAVSTSSAK